MERRIAFKAWYIAGKNQEIKAMIERVSIYGAGYDAEYCCGLNDEDFNDQLKEQTGFEPDDEYDVYSKGDVQIILSEFGAYEGDEWKFLKAELFQFTGFKDRFENDIYEGDILRDDYGHEWEVIFYNGCFWLYRPGHGGMNKAFSWPENCYPMFRIDHSKFSHIVGHKKTTSSWEAWIEPKND